MWERAYMRVNSLQEYKDFVEKHNIPLDTIRFALGEDKGHEPRWFYIYQDRFTGEWVVAKNKNDGSTAERYRGFDEAAACQILFDKMQEEFNKRQYASGSGSSRNEYGGHKKKRNATIIFDKILIIITLIVSVYILAEGYFDRQAAKRRPGQGYYVFQVTYDDGSLWDDLYYYLDGDWYYYDDEYNDWYWDGDFAYDDDYVRDYYVGSYYSSLDGYYDGDAWDFDDTSYYQNYEENRYNNSDNNYYDDDDDDDSWDSYDWDDWDSNDSDWDSDW